MNRYDGIGLMEDRAVRWLISLAITACVVAACLLYFHGSEQVDAARHAYSEAWNADHDLLFSIDRINRPMKTKEFLPQSVLDSMSADRARAYKALYSRIQPLDGARCPRDFQIALDRFVQGALIVAANETNKSGHAMKDDALFTLARIAQRLGVADKDGVPIPAAK